MSENTKKKKIKETKPESSGDKKNGSYVPQIIIGVIGVIAIILIVLLLLPSNGELAGTLTGTDFNGDGSAIRIRADVTNGTNKVAFGVTYEFEVVDTEGNIVGTFTSDRIAIMFPGTTKSVEEFIYFEDVKIDTGDVEIKVNGYVIGG